MTISGACVNAQSGEKHTPAQRSSRLLPPPSLTFRRGRQRGYLPVTRKNYGSRRCSSSITCADLRRNWRSPKSLAQDFRVMVTRQQEANLGRWLKEAQDSGIAELRSLAVGILRDFD